MCARQTHSICGRGSRIHHAGNLRFRQVCAAHKEAYQRAKRRDEKTRITNSIVESLQNGPEPSRFLLRDAKTNNGWIDVGLEYAKEKVRMSFASFSNQTQPNDHDLKKTFLFCPWIAQVSHALRSRPSEERRTRRKQQKSRAAAKQNRANKKMASIVSSLGAAGQPPPSSKANNDVQYDAAHDDGRTQEVTLARTKESAFSSGRRGDNSHALPVTYSLVTLK